MKSTLLSVRISSDLRQKLEEQSDLENRSISKVARDILEHEFNTTFQPEHSFDVEVIGEYSDNSIEELLTSFRFAEFMFWLQQVRYSPDKNRHNQYYIQFSKTIDDICCTNLFPQTIVDDLHKVKKELIYCIDFKLYTFSFPKNYDGFDYNLLNDFMDNIRYDVNGNDQLNIF
ncbi:hypothetical protein [Psychroflexus sp. ALD_RP9]|uniref:hypothetical protein n=1 Tax=Psychroflexus sp. ALD_RP9 TaxID=2777186 RepID=UPI001A8E7345|nr:hypothetical protein [Psychroflexus sp. ALD_RP9]QSS97817.1 hypothetical protein IMZ30_03640 [Psychroflexus sp. ALD_RP9]